VFATTKVDYLAEGLRVRVKLPLADAKPMAKPKAAKPAKK
jgi:hypothetical protein